MKIYSPVENFNGIRCNVRFVKGVGESDDPQAIEWFKQHGYTVEYPRVEQAATVQSETTVEDEGTVTPPDTSEFDGMTPNELREWMKNNGMGSLIKNIRNKDKLIALIMEARNGN